MIHPVARSNVRENLFHFAKIAKRAAKQGIGHIERDTKPEECAGIWILSSDFSSSDAHRCSRSRILSQSLTRRRERTCDWYKTSHKASSALLPTSREIERGLSSRCQTAVGIGSQAHAVGHEPGVARQTPQYRRNLAVVAPQHCNRIIARTMINPPASDGFGQLVRVSLHDRMSTKHSDAVFCRTANRCGINATPYPTAHRHTQRSAGSPCAAKHRGTRQSQQRAKPVASPPATARIVNFGQIHKQCLAIISTSVIR